MTKPFRGILARLRLASFVCAGLLLTMPSSARAEELTGAAASVEAKRLFSQGSALYLAGQYEKALEPLQTSRKLVPSPNSELVIARCLRELGRLVEAKEMFESAELEARRRAAEGAPKYAQTAESAATEGAAVRAALGAIHVRLEGVDSTTKLEVDAVPTEVPPSGDVVVWHTPGEVAVSMRSSSGLEQRQVVTVRAGAEVTIGFGRPEPPPAEQAPSSAPAPTPPPASPQPPVDRVPDTVSPRPSWAVPAAVVSGGLTLVGAGMFAGFGIATNNEYARLQSQCPQGCSPGDKSRANVGKTDQLIANVSLGVASAAAVATATFAVIAITHPLPSKTNSETRWRLLVGGATIGVAGEFQ